MSKSAFLIHVLIFCYGYTLTQKYGKVGVLGDDGGKQVFNYRNLKTG